MVRVGVRKTDDFLWEAWKGNSLWKKRYMLHCLSMLRVTALIKSIQSFLEMILNIVWFFDNITA